jgi:hypothetical protein
MTITLGLSAASPLLGEISSVGTPYITSRNENYEMMNRRALLAGIGIAGGIPSAAALPSIALASPQPIMEESDDRMFSKVFRPLRIQRNTAESSAGTKSPSKTQGRCLIPHVAADDLSATGQER